MKLEDVKLEQLRAVGTKRIYGSVVKGSPRSDAADASSKWIAIRPCLCVWDSPDSPCRCMSSILYWVLERDINKSGRIDRKSSEGEKLYSFDIDRKAQIGVEVLRGRSIASIPADHAEVTRKLARVAANIKRLKQARGQSVAGVATGAAEPGVAALSWDDFTEGVWGALEGLESIFDAGEASGIDWEELIGIVIILL